MCIRNDEDMDSGRVPQAVRRLNVQEVNAVSRAVGEVRRVLGVRAAAKALPEIYAKAGIRIKASEPEQGELELESSSLRSD